MTAATSAATPKKATAPVKSSPSPVKKAATVAKVPVKPINKPAPKPAPKPAVATHAHKAPAPAPAQLPPGVKAAETGGLLIPVSKIRVIDNASRYFTEDKESPAFKGLKDSIRATGLVQPIALIEGEDGKYILAAGARRLRAVKELDHKEIRAVVLPASIKSGANIAENIHRLDPTPMEIALFIETVAKQNKWKVPGENTKDMAKLLNKSAAYVTQHAKLLVHGEKERKLIHEGQLSARAGFDVADLRKALEGNGVGPKVLEEILERAAGKEVKKAEAKAAAKPEPKKEPAAKRELIPGTAEQTKQMRKEIAAKKAAAAAKKAPATSTASVREAAAEVAAERGGAVAKAIKESGVTSRERKLSEFAELVKAMEGENEGATQFAEQYSRWEGREVSDDDFLKWMITIFEQVQI